MDRNLLKDFWSCGDNDIIEFALERARLNRNERTVIHFMLDECFTQERIAEEMEMSTRRVQEFWYAGADKLLRIPWVRAYAAEIRKSRD